MLASGTTPVGRFKCWTWTLFLENEKKNEQYDENTINKVYDEKKGIIKYICYQREICPTTGRHHLQGYIQMYNGHECSYKTIKKHFKCNWMKLFISRGDNNENKNYCSKLHSACPDTFVEFGQMDNVAGKRTDWDYVRDLVAEGRNTYEIVMECTNKIPFINCIEKLCMMRDAKNGKKRKFVKNEVVVFTGDAGSDKTKKSLYHENLEVDEDVFQVETDDSGKLWFDGYDKEKILVIDDFYGNIKYDYILRLLDGHRQRLPVKGGFVYKNWEKVIITSNQHPSKWYRFGMTPALHRRINKYYHFSANGDIKPYDVKIDTNVDNGVSYNEDKIEIALN